jgi:pimeloyl-ACP methyl ester carboxylesterase
VDSVVAAAGIDVAVREFGGSGTPVLLLHGAGNTVADMAPLARCLTVDHRVVGMDLRNHGRSADGPWTWDAVLGDVAAVIDALELTGPLLVGHSLGGMLALLYADRHDDVAGAANLDGFGTGTPEQYDLDLAEVNRLLEQLHQIGDATIAASAEPLTAEQVDVGKRAWVEGARALGLDVTLAGEAFDRRLVVGADGTFTRRPGAEQLVELWACMDDLDVLGLYAKVTTPQLVFVAVRDQSSGLPPELGALAAARTRFVTAELRRISQARPNVSVTELDATHGLVYEQPQLIAEQVSAFATALAPQTSGRR